MHHGFQSRGVLALDPIERVSHVSVVWVTGMVNSVSPAVVK